MSEKEFVIWLHGYFEINNPKTIGEKETQIIKDHLDTFFKKVTPYRSGFSRVEDTLAIPQLTTTDTVSIPSISSMFCMCYAKCTCGKPKLDLGAVIC